MKARVAICTPTHDPQFLKRAALGICQQTDLENVEWLILANGPATLEAVAREVAEASRAGVHVRIVRYEGESRKIGALKRAAFMAAAGDVLIELDHDDVLAPRAVEAVREAFAAGANVVYSNGVLFDDEGRAVRWPRSVPTRKATLYGVEYDEGIASLAAHPLILHGTWGGPFHLRAYRSDFYRLIGGHSPDVSITEDMNLLARAYIATDKFTHIDEPLYLFRVHIVNAFWETRTEVQDWVVPIAESVCETWATREGLAIIDGLGALRDYTGSGAGLVRLGDECDGENQDAVLREAWRKMTPNGFLFFAAQTWKRNRIAPFTSIKFGKADQVERFQSLGVNVYNNPHPKMDGNYTVEEIRSFHGARGILVAIKRWSRLWGNDPFEPLVDESEHPGLKPVYDTFGVAVTYRDGKAFIKGERAAEACEMLNAYLFDCFAVAK